MCNIFNVYRTKAGWVYKGTEHERAQLACGELILSLDGRRVAQVYKR